MRHHLPERVGLYDPRHERDACGAGFIADLHGRKSHDILQKALAALCNLEHRGAVSADGLSGDGSGVLTQIPYEFFREEARKMGFSLDNERDLAVGMFFLPGQNPEACSSVVDIATEIIQRSGLQLLGWRKVPIGKDSLGEQARATCPDVRQTLMLRPQGLSDVEFERLLYITRKRIERRVRNAGLGPFYIPSFSSQTIAYKGLMVPSRITSFFPDLAEPTYTTAIVVFHQRYSTNTFPTWFLAHPFRFLAHNGEINTLQGNANWMRAREPELQSAVWGNSLRDLLPVVQEGGSDSAHLDNVFEFLVMSGRDPLHAMMMMMPEAYGFLEQSDPDLCGFFQYHATLMEPWDGPAAVVFTNGEVAAACLDRNGLRPLRYTITADGLVVVGSEAGLVPIDGEIIEKGRLGPGKMLAVDTVNHRFLHNEEIKQEYIKRKPYRQWVESQMVDATKEIAQQTKSNGVLTSAPSAETLLRTQKIFGYGKEDIDRILQPMMQEAKIPVGSMGDDTPVAVLSQQPQLMYRYFKQRFAQVTNPPIDPLRERLVMSLNTAVGGRGCALEEKSSAAHLIKFASPILTEKQFRWLMNLEDPQFRARTIQARFPITDGPGGLEKALSWLCQEAERAVDAQCSLIVLSDRGVDAQRAPIPMLLATAAVHHHLIRVGKRMQASIICDSGEPREDHHFACLIGYGAALIYPYLALQTVTQMAAADEGKEGAVTADKAIANFIHAVEEGILKIMSKMGISTVSSYRGAQIFECVGIAREVIDRFFCGTETRIEGIRLLEIAIDVLRFHYEAFQEEADLTDRGHYRYLGAKGGEYHAFNPNVFKWLHKAVRNQDWNAFQEYSRNVDDHSPCNIRDLITWKKQSQPIPLDEVEPADEIARRFTSQAMSHGALSRECHEVLGIAMNRIGGKSNSGEGGEARERFRPYEADHPELSHAPWHPQKGDLGNSAIKQVASGRFGVTPEYLISAKEIEIKMAQGAKPGEGGQIPGHKVTDEIALIRRAVPGVTLISPPPHHDIYSIEDLSQLIYDLKRVNRKSKVCVKLVSVVGVGTVAAGVAKGYADCIQISGHDGGTGASPLSSLKHAGLPWEMGLAEAQQVLVINDLRGRVTLRVDGGLKTGRDVVLGALLGAEQFGFGTAAVIAAGCVMARRCHLNNCPVGIASQRPELRKKFPGTPDHIVNFLLYVAEQVRMIMAEMGVRKFEDLVGRVDLIELKRTVMLPKTTNIDLSAILTDPDPSGTKPKYCHQDRNDRPDDDNPLDERVWQENDTAIQTGETVVHHHDVTNRDRSVGARLSGEIARHTGPDGLSPGTLQLFFKGSVGQSFAVFCNRGMLMHLEGEAQDYVGKSMYGGTIIIVPPKNSNFATHENAILGNTVMYGATGGNLFAAGLAGERLCVRNSGGRVVVEGCGDHGCEYMTNGIVVVLGATGRNFGAGMSGGIAYVFDMENKFEEMYNPSMVLIRRVEHDIDETLLRRLIESHVKLTGSMRGAWILEHWEETLPKFWKIEPHPSAEEKSAHDQDAKLIEEAALRDFLAEDIESLVLAERS